MSSIQFAYGDPDPSVKLNRPLILLIVLGVIFSSVVTWFSGKSYLVLGLYAIPLVPLLLLNTRIALYAFVLSFAFSVTLIELNNSIHLRADDFLFPLLYLVWFFERMLNPGKRFAEKVFTFPILLYVAVVGVLSLYSTVNFGTFYLVRAGYYFIKLLQYVMLYFIVSDLISSENARRILLRIVIVSTVVITFYGLIEFHVLGHHLATGPLSDNHAHMGAYLAFMIYVFGGYAFSTKNIFEKLFCLLFIPIMFYVLVISASRAGILGAAAAIGVLLLFTKRPLLMLLAIVFGALAFTFGADYLLKMKDFSSTLANFKDMESDLSFMGRVFIWLSVFKMVQSDPSVLLTGIGIGNFLHGTAPYMFLLKSATGAHNNYIHVLVETGIMGLLSFLYMLFSFLRRSLAKFRNKLNRERYLFYGYFCGICALLITCLTQETFSVQTAQGNFLGFFFIFTAILFYQKQD